jgi:hypothetical protein
MPLYTSSWTFCNKIDCERCPLKDDKGLISMEDDRFLNCYHKLLDILTKTKCKECLINFECTKKCKRINTFLK